MNLKTLLDVLMFPTSLSKVRNVKVKSCLKSGSLNHLHVFVRASLFCIGFFIEKLNNRCSYTGHFYRGKWVIGVVRVTGLSHDKFTMENIHGYVKKKKETAHDI